MNKNIFYISIFFIVIFSFWVNLAQAANTTLRSEEDKRVEEEKRVALERTEVGAVSKEKNWSMEMGGWFSSLFIYNQDDDNNSELIDLVRSAWFQDFRLWTNIVYKQKASLYIRVKDIYIQRDASDDYTGVGDDNSGLSLDLGYANISLGDLTKFVSNLIIGRQYLALGRAIVYNKINDGLQFSADFSNWGIKTFASQTVPYEDNLDYSVPGYDKNGDRSFYGLQLDYKGLRNNIIYTYMLIQRDRAKEDPEDTGQDYTYNSEYYGLGLAGRANKEKIEYWAEVIKETGTDYTDSSVSTLTQTYIDAFGFDAGVKRRFASWMHPTLDFEYSFGTGDRDRSRVDITKSGGNTSPGDTNFLYFGGLYAGYALAPRLSNIHIYKIGSSFIPFEKAKIGENFVCGFKYYYYVKAKSQGGISDLEAVEYNSNIGQELDIYTYCKTTLNSYLSIRGGIFFPGDAYLPSSNDRETYTLISFTTAF